ncbi:hypothetical protein CC2G_004861 [Coprinopsis cinerea AmutBmut pab1-1]|nr:hypothetical protein CC2G_004861 [Coprinopsis cinerea AmutBmut pab1-1]
MRGGRTSEEDRVYAAVLQSHCDTGYMICGILSIFGHIGILAVWSLRTCAVYNNNKFLMALFGSMTASSVILLCIRAPHMKCTGMKDMSKSVYGVAISGANGAIVLALEILAFLLATFRVWKTRREIKQKTESTKVASLNEIIFSQGILYIGGVTVLSVGVLILNFKAKTGFVSRLLNGLKLPLSGFLTARFMLRLRAWSAIGSPNPHSATTTGTTTVPPMQFGEQHTFMGEFKGELGARSTRLSSDFDDTTTCGRDEQRGEQMTELRHHHHVGSSRDSFTRKRASGSAVDLEEGAYSPRPVFDTKGKGVQSADEGNDHDEDPNRPKAFLRRTYDLETNYSMKYLFVVYRLYGSLIASYVCVICDSIRPWWVLNFCESSMEKCGRTEANVQSPTGDWIPARDPSSSTTPVKPPTQGIEYMLEWETGSSQIRHD